MILPGSFWVAKQNNYINGTYFCKGDQIEVDSIWIGKETAKVTFDHNLRRLTLDAMFFRKRFKRQERNEV